MSLLCKNISFDVFHVIITGCTKSHYLHNNLHIILELSSLLCKFKLWKGNCKLYSAWFDSIASDAWLQKWLYECMEYVLCQDRKLCNAYKCFNKSSLKSLLIASLCSVHLNLNHCFNMLQLICWQCKILFSYSIGINNSMLQVFALT